MLKIKIAKLVNKHDTRSAVPTSQDWPTFTRAFFELRFYAWNGLRLQTLFGREPWSSIYERRLMFKRLWVRIPVLHFLGGHFFTSIWCKNWNVVWKDRKETKKEAGDGPFRKSSIGYQSFCKIMCLLGRFYLCSLIRKKHTFLANVNEMEIFVPCY